MKNKKAVLYSRVSTDEQASEGMSLDVQQEMCTEMIKKDGFILKEVIRDEGKTGKNMNRPGIQKILQLIEEKKIDAIYAVSNDRIARNTLDFLTFSNILLRNGITLRFVRDPNLDNSAGSKMTRTVMAAFSEYTSNVIAEKVKDNMYAKAQAGYFPAVAPLGYKNAADPHATDRKAAKIIIPDPERAPLITEAFKLFATGNYNVYNLNDIMHEKGLTSRKGTKFSVSRFHGLLRNPVYIGELHWGEVFVKEAKHEPLVDRETFNKVQSILEGHNHHGCRRRKHTWLLSGYVWCGRHPLRRYTAEWHIGKKLGYYHCPNNTGCGKYVQVPDLEQAVADKFKEIEFTPEFVDMVISKARAQLALVKKEALVKKQSFINQKTALEAKRKTAQEKLLEGVFSNDDFLKIKTETDEKLEQLALRIEEEEEKELVAADILEEILRFSQNVYTAYMKAPYYIKRHYLSFFWDKFEVVDGVIIKSYPSLLFRQLLDIQAAYIKALKTKKHPKQMGVSSVIISQCWYPHQESNLDLLLRRESFYPLNYGGNYTFFIYPSLIISSI
jgi:site-specific DNA recombinase